MNGFELRGARLVRTVIARAIITRAMITGAMLALVMSMMMVLPARAEHTEELAAQVMRLLPKVTGAEAVASPIDGIYEIRFQGGILYATHDGRYVFGGPLLDLETKQNLTENFQREQRAEILAAAAENTMIIFEPKGPAKFTITTFTDIDCGYCRKMHEEIKAITDAGIRVRYMLFPRSGIGSDSHRKAVAVWCADDRNDAITYAKAGHDPGHETCSNPVEAHMKLARKLGLRGTPFTLTEEGHPINGYVPSHKLVQQLAALKG